MTSQSHARLRFPGDNIAMRESCLHLPLFCPLFPEGTTDVFCVFKSSSEVLGVFLLCPHWYIVASPLQVYFLDAGMGLCCVPSGVVSSCFEVSIHLGFPLSILFGSFKALQKCSHF